MNCSSPPQRVRRSGATGTKAAIKRLGKLATSGMEGQRLMDLCRREFDLAVKGMVEEVDFRVGGSLDGMKNKLDLLEQHNAELVARHQWTVQESNRQRLQQVQDERVEKKLLCQWLNGFLRSADADPVLDPVDFAFTRFALNVAVAAPETPPQRLFDAKAPDFAVAMLRSANDVVLGSTALALCHMSLHDELKQAIVDANALASVANNLVTNNSPAVLTQLCKVSASLALDHSLKNRVGGEGVGAALVDMLNEPLNQDFVRCTDGPRAAALQALVNMTFGSDSNRNLVVELNGVRPVVEACMVNTDSHVIEHAARLLGNMAFNDPATALRILQAQGSEALCSAVKVCNLLEDGRILHAAVTALTNLCNNEMNQIHVGAGDALGLAVHLCRHAPQPEVLFASAKLVTALAFQSPVNKARLGEKGAIKSLLSLLEHHGFGPPERTQPFVRAVTAACEALGSLLLYGNNIFIMRDVWGLKTLTDLCLATEDMPVLHAGVMAISAMCPDPETRFDAHDEGRPLQVEQVPALAALDRAKDFVFGRKPTPRWLEEASNTMAMSEDELRQAKVKANQQGERINPPPIERVERQAQFFEFDCPVHADHIVQTNLELHDLLYRAY